MHIINPYRYAAAGGGGGVPVVEDFTGNIQDASNAIITLTAPAGITSGELLVLMVGSDNSSAIWPIITDWTRLINITGGNTTIGFYYKIATGSETDVDVNGATVDKIGWYLRISGVNTTTPIDNSGTGTGANSVHAIPSINTTQDNCLALYCLSFDGGDGYPFSVAGAGWSQSDELRVNEFGNTSSGCFGTKEQASTGATGDATVTCSVSDGATYFQVSIAPA